ncbi:hypothetical protein RND81_09G077900 [Saponaria officinalis]|uniref:BTB/POZ domain-containing protein n=1 Tax=Saponaria officinalis TaxID=3572 RepID=A0AAW1IK33_SAPOF
MNSEPNNRVKLNAGGKHFETTFSTLQHSSLLLPTTTTTTIPLFMDVDPHHMSTLLSHSRRPPLCSPPPLSPFDASLSSTVSPPLHPLISTFSLSSSSLLLAHGGLISRFHPSSLSLSSSTRTHLHHISSLSPVSATVSAAASDFFSSPPGLHLFDPTRHLATILWSDTSDPRTDKSRVTALDSSESESTHLFACFDCRHRENAVLVLDKSTLRVVSEIGRQSGNSAKSAALSKLKWVPSMGVLVGSSVTGGAFGYSGYIRMWDTRSGKEVWETGEPGGSGRSNRLGDTMADVDVDVDGMYIAKVGSRSGDVGVADMRRLGDDPWVYLEDSNPGLRGSGPVRESAVVHCWKEHIFVARDRALEAWSRVNGGGGGEGETRWGRYRRNYVDKEEDEKRGIIRKIGGGGNRLFVARENVEGVEVWEGSRSSGLIMVS